MYSDKSDLKGFQTNFETFFYKYQSQSDTCQSESALEEKVHVHFWKKTLLVWRKNSSSMTVATSFSSNPFSDLKESIIHFHRWLVRGFCFAIYSSNGQIEQVDLQRLTESVFEVELKTFKWICCGLKLKSNEFEQSWLFMNIRGHHMVSSRFLINDIVFTIEKFIWIARK